MPEAFYQSTASLTLGLSLVLSAACAPVHSTPSSPNDVEADEETGWDPLVTALFDLSTRDEALEELIERGVYSTAAAHEESRPTKVREVVACPQVSGAPLIVAFVGAGKISRNASPRRGRFIVLRTDGTLVPFPGGANFLEGHLGDINGDGLMEFVEAEMNRASGVRMLRVIPVEEPFSPSFRVFWTGSEKNWRLAQPDPAQLPIIQLYAEATPERQGEATSARHPLEARVTLPQAMARKGGPEEDSKENPAPPSPPFEPVQKLVRAPAAPERILSEYRFDSGKNAWVGPSGSAGQGYMVVEGDELEAVDSLTGGPSCISTTMNAVESLPRVRATAQLATSGARWSGIVHPSTPNREHLSLGFSRDGSFDAVFEVRVMGGEIEVIQGGDTLSIPEDMERRIEVACQHTPGTPQGISRPEGAPLP